MRISRSGSRGWHAAASPAAATSHRPFNSTFKLKDRVDLHRDPKRQTRRADRRARVTPGLTGLAQSLNAEERAHGLRACSIFPGDIDTDILNKRPIPPTPEARAKMMRPADIAACVWLAVSLPQRAVVEELLVRPL